jgi:hypothetical protein
MLFGFFVAGLLYVFFKPEKIKQYLGTGKIKPVIISALFGIPIPLCSCGVVPVATSEKSIIELPEPLQKWRLILLPVTSVRKVGT